MPRQSPVLGSTRILKRRVIMLVTLMILACLVGVWRASFVAVDLNNCGIDRILMDSPDDWCGQCGDDLTQ